MNILYHYLLGWCFCLKTMITEMKRQSITYGSTEILEKVLLEIDGPTHDTPGL